MTTADTMGPTAADTTFRDAEQRYERRLSGDGYLVARLDGRRFSKLTAGLYKPYDRRFQGAMVAATLATGTAAKAVLAYTHSDEVTLVWARTSDAGFAGRVVKLASSLSAMLTLEFYLAARERGLFADDRPTFDCRVFELDAEDVQANLLWRRQDAYRNAAFSAARFARSHEWCEQHTVAELAALTGLETAYPEPFFRGSCFVRMRELVAVDRSQVPEAHRDRVPVHTVRNRWVPVDDVTDAVMSALPFTYTGSHR